MRVGIPKVTQFYAMNQFLIEGQDPLTGCNITVFQSYNSIIAMIKNGQTYLDTNCWDYSKTTGKYRNKFLGEGIAETRAKIKSGQYILTNLN